jgi:hypothetical protein
VKIVISGRQSKRNGTPTLPSSTIHIQLHPAYIEQACNVLAAPRRNNFPNPIQPGGSYAPINTPALDDLWDFFDFGQSWGPVRRQELTKLDLKEDPAPAKLPGRDYSIGPLLAELSTIANRPSHSLSA